MRKCPRAGLGCRPNHDGQGEDPIEECSGQISPEPIEISPEHTWSYPEPYQFAKSQKIMKVSFLELIKICAIFLDAPLICDDL